MSKKMLDEEGRAVYSGDRCISCTSCMSDCPVMAAAKAYRGPKLVGPAHGRMHFSENDTEQSLEDCINCKTCDRACPSGVSVSTMNMLQRGEYYRRHPHTQRDDLLAHVERMAKRLHAYPLGTTVANLGMRIGKYAGMFDSMGIAGKRYMPPYASQTFMQEFQKIRQPAFEKKVVFYPGCFINYHEPHIGIAFVTVMNKNGYEVLLDEQFTCCGSPLVITGYLDEAHEHAENNTARILAWKEQGIPVVSCCTSCSLMLRKEYEELFGEAAMKEAGENVYDAFEFLEMLDAEGAFNTELHPVQKRFLYHVPCHLKTQGIGTPVVSIFRHLPGAGVELADAGCCGMGGNYGFKKDKYDITMKIGEKLFARIASAKADAVICDCPTCRMQIRQGTQTNPVHPIEVLADAYK